jgi:hypothetical protein
VDCAGVELHPIEYFTPGTRRGRSNDPNSPAGFAGHLRRVW